MPLSFAHPFSNYIEEVRFPNRKCNETCPQFPRKGRQTTIGIVGQNHRSSSTSAFYPLIVVHRQVKPSNFTSNCSYDCSSKFMLCVC